MMWGVMSESSNQRRKAGLIPAAGLTLALLLAGCQPGPPSTPPETSGPTPGPSEPAGRSVHFTAQGDIGVSTGARKVLHYRRPPARAESRARRLQLSGRH